MTKPEKMLAHELLDREVLNLQAGEVAGSVVDFGINRDGKVQLIGILPVAWYSGGRAIAPSSITFVTEDRLCIPSGDALQDFSPDGDSLISTDSGGQIYGKMVLLHDGEQLGELVDFRFSLADGTITDLLVLDPEDKRVRIPIGRISTIGKDYIIIERQAEEGAAGAVESTADLAAEPVESEEESPFVEAAAAPEPAAAKRSTVAARKGRAGKTSRKTESETELASEEPQPESLPDVVAETAGPPVEPEPVPVIGDVLAPHPAPEQATAFADIPAVSELSAAAEEVSLFHGGQQISKFDQKKLDFLRGKLAARDIKDPEGVILVAKDEELDQAGLLRIMDAGMLGEVFIEMTLRK